MKYHSPLRIVFIALITSLVFIAVSICSVFFLGAYSPTELLVKRAIAELDRGDDLSFSFSSLEKNMMGSITLDDVSLSLRGKDVVQIERVRFSSSLFSLIKSIFGRNGTFDIEFYNPIIELGEDDIAFISSLFPPKEDPSSGEKGEAADYRFNLHLHSLDFSYESVSLKDAEIFVVLSSGNLIEEVEFKLDEFSFEYDSLSLYSTAIDARLLNNHGSYSFNGGFKSLELEYSDFGAQLENVALKASIGDIFSPDISTLDAQLSFTGGDVYYSDEFYSRYYPAYIRLDNEMIYSAVSLIVASYENYAISISDLSASYSLSEKSFSVDSVNTVIYDETEPLLNIENALINGSVENRSAHISVRSIGSDYINEYISAFSFMTLSGLNIDITYDSMLNLSFDSYLELNSEEAILDGINMRLSSALVYEDEIQSLSLSLNNIKLTENTAPMHLNLRYVDKRADLYFIYSDYVRLDASIGNEVSVDATIDELSLSEFSPYINRYIPFLENYIDRNTLLNGILNVSLSADDFSIYGYSGDISYAIGISGIRFSRFTFNTASSLSSTLSGNTLDISSFNLTTDLVRFAFTGGIDLESYLPSGHLVIENTSSGKDYATLDLSLNRDREYEFDFRIPRYEQMSLNGLFNFEDATHLFSDASLYTQSRSYEFFVDFDFIHQRFSIENEMARLYFSYGDRIVSYLDFTDFVLPRREAGLPPASLSGHIDFLFDITEQDIDIISKDFNIHNLYLLEGNPDVAFSISGDNDSFHIYDVSFLSENFIPLTGEAVYSYDEHTFALALESESESLGLSIMPYEDYMTGLFVVKDFSAARLRLGNNLINATLSGMGADFDSLSFSGEFRLSSIDPSVPMTSSAGVFINSREIVISDFIYETSSLSLSIDDASLNSNSGQAVIPISLTYTLSNNDRDYPVDLALEIEAEADEEENLYSFIRRIYETDFTTVSGTISLDHLDIDDALVSRNRNSAFNYRDGSLSFSGDFLSGTYSIPLKKLDVDVQMPPVAKISATGDFNNSIDLVLDIEDFSLYTANIFLKYPVITFTEDSNANGRLSIIGSPGDIHMFGSLWSENIEFDVFWLPNEHIIAHDMTFTVWDNDIESAMTSLTTINTRTGVRQAHKGRLCFYLNESLGIDYYTVDVYVKEGREIDFRLPMANQNIDIVGRVSGAFHLNQRGMEYVSLSGDMNIIDTQLSFGMYEMPEWFHPRIKVGYDFNLNLKKNNTFVFPLGPNPIFSATAAENQFLHFYTAEDGGLGASGAIDLRAGEIYYFQRSFFIREGSINFRENEMYSIDPIINLRASLRAFDSQGEQVDIYLVLREARLNNFTPTFESSPAKSLSEIMSILGQAIVNNEGENNLGSVVSLLTTGMDVLQRIGLVRQNDNGLQMSIRNSLNLDTFSLHTNIIGNLVYDAVISSQNSASWNISPLARYLDGTALYIGKYLTPELYFEALAHLSAQRRTDDEEISSFLSSDLSLDVEISLEWENPLCTISLFTRPKSLTLDDTLRYMGITFTKRFVF